VFAICAAAWGEKFCVKNLLVELLLQLTPVQLVQPHSMPFEPILLYLNII